MKFRLVETLEQPFVENIELEYDASDLCSQEESCYGTVFYTVGATDVLECLWDFLTEDKKPPLTEEEFERFSEDDDVWQAYVTDNFDTLYKRYTDNFYDKFEDDAREKLYDNWEKYSDERPFSLREEDEREFWRNVWH